MRKHTLTISLAAILLPACHVAIEVDSPNEAPPESRGENSDGVENDDTEPQPDDDEDVEPDVPGDGQDIPAPGDDDDDDASPPGDSSGDDPNTEDPPSASPTPAPPDLEWPSTPPGVDAAVSAQLPLAGAPGAAACIVKDGEVVWCDAWGLAHVADNAPATPHTPFLVASVSKTVTAAGIVLYLEENGGLSALGDDVREAVPFSIDAPNPGPITWQQLMTHTAGLRDDWDQLDQLYNYPDTPDAEASPPTPLADAVESYFSAGGDLYGSSNFQSWAPGGGFDYTNMGVALAGTALEMETGVPFSNWMQEHVLAPLGMTRSSFDWRALSDVVVAMPYTAGEQPVGYYNFADTPDGALRSTAYDMARFLAMLSNGGLVDGERLLSTSSAEAMATSYATDQGDGVGLGLFSWEYGGTWWGHNGAEAGAVAQLAWRDDGIGYVLLLNGDSDEEGVTVEAIEDVLMPFAETL